MSVPFGAPYENFGIYDTEYRTVCNLTGRRYFFELTTSPNVLGIDLGKLNFAAGAPVLALDPNDLSLSGDVTDRLVPTTQPYPADVTKGKTTESQPSPR